MTTPASPTTPAEDENATTTALHAAADDLEHDLHNDPALPDVTVTVNGGPPILGEIRTSPDPAAPDTLLGQHEADRAALFDPSKFDDPKLELKTVDGRNVDAIVLKVAGTIKLERSNPSDVALYKRLRQGGRFDFEIETVVTDDGHKVKLDADGYPQTTTGTKTLKVTGLTELELPDLAPKPKTATVDETFGAEGQAASLAAIGQRPCGACDGLGNDPLHGDPCKTCDGLGYLPLEADLDDHSEPDPETAA